MLFFQSPSKSGEGHECFRETHSIAMLKRDLDGNSREKHLQLYHYGVDRNDGLGNGFKKITNKKRVAGLPSQEFVEDCHLAAFWQPLEGRFYRYRGLSLFFILINLFFWYLLLVERRLMR